MPDLINVVERSEGLILPQRFNTQNGVYLSVSKGATKRDGSLRTVNISYDTNSYNYSAQACREMIGLFTELAEALEEGAGE